MRLLPLLFFVLLTALARAEDRPIAPNDPAWGDLAAAFAVRPDTTAPFSEQRHFPFRKAPLELSGISRVSTSRGLSLAYTSPEKSTVIFDEQGLLVRQTGVDTAGPADPRAGAANRALVQVLRFDLPALGAHFELLGQRDGTAWTLRLVPRAAELRRALAEILVAGEAAAVRRIVIRRSAKQFVEITVGPARSGAFTAGELKEFFR